MSQFQKDWTSETGKGAIVRTPLALGRVGFPDDTGYIISHSVKRLR